MKEWEEFGKQYLWIQVTLVIILYGWLYYKGEWNEKPIMCENERRNL